MEQIPPLLPFDISSGLGIGKKYFFFCPHSDDVDQLISTKISQVSDISDDCILTRQKN